LEKWSYLPYRFSANCGLVNKRAWHISFSRNSDLESPRNFTRKTKARSTSSQVTVDELPTLGEWHQLVAEFPNVAEFAKIREFGYIWAVPKSLGFGYKL
jgi:hypothetical protein